MTYDPGPDCGLCGANAAACARGVDRSPSGLRCCGLCHRFNRHLLARDRFLDVLNTADWLRSIGAPHTHERGDQ